MKLCNGSLQDVMFWHSKNYELPLFDRAAVCKQTSQAPRWLHFGAGNIFRAFPAMLCQRLLNEGLTDTGIIIAEGFDYELIDAAYMPFDNLSISVTLIPDGTVRKAVVGSVTQCVKTDAPGMERLRDIFKSESLQMVSFTITEKGYYLTRADGTLSGEVLEDFKNGPGAPATFLGKLASLCLHRYQNGAYPLALVSMDNCSGNGELLHDAVFEFAKQWVSGGFAQPGFADYLGTPGGSRKSALSFPCTMIDKITPYPDESVAKMLADDGIEGMVSHITGKKSVTAPFVNSEAPEYLVIEDIFPGGRPPLENAGVIFTDREHVDKTEKMKVCTCLNPLHTALSVFACLLGYTRVSEAMRDTDLRALVELVAKEGMRVVTHPGIIDPREFADTVINIRLPNPYIPDTPQRIATDTSRKLAVRFGETIKAYLQNRDLDTNILRGIPLAIAGWFRYLTGIDDCGNAFEPDPDPMQEELRGIFGTISPVKETGCESKLRPLLENSAVFGINLYEAGVAHKVVSYFEMMIKGPGAVRETLRQHGS